MSRRPVSLLIVLVIVFGLPLLAQKHTQKPDRKFSNHYALVLSDPAVVEHFPRRESLHSTAALDYRRQVETRQQALKSELTRRRFHVVGSVSTLSNAVFVASTPERVKELQTIPGVAGVIRMRVMHSSMNRAVQLMNAPAVWSMLGGVNQAGAGIKIAILDSGIDQTHPAFQDNSLQVPAGFPICTTDHPEDCSFTNNKVIVARSYVRQMGAGSDPNNVAANSIPDDPSPRDRLGHGTAVASVAAANQNTGAITFNGMAPKAFLGNYKITGSPEIFGGTFEDVSVMAINDAFNDGMDIANYSYGSLAITGPLDTGATCGLPVGVPCDFAAWNFEKAARAGMIITVAVGNLGDGAQQFPSYYLVSSPANAPSVISVGATMNSHVIQPAVSVLGGPDNLQLIAAQTSDLLADFPFAYYFPMVDVTQIGDDGTACKSLAAGSLNGAIALIQQSTTPDTCSFSDQAYNASDAGAFGVIFYMASSAAAVPAEVGDGFGDFPSLGTVVVVSQSDGQALKTYIDANPGTSVLVDPAGAEMDLSAYNALWGFNPPLAANQLLNFSSPGPDAGDYTIKPDIVAVGGGDLNNAPSFPDGNVLAGQSGLYLAAQSFDPYGELFSIDGYFSADGTSFAAPMAAGAAALLKQLRPQLSASQIKALMMNSAAQDTTTDEFGDPVDVISVGAGRLDAGAAAKTNVIATVVTSDGSNPVSLSFGALTASSLPVTKQVQISNLGSSDAVLTLGFANNQTVKGITLAVDQSSVTVPAGKSVTVKVTLSGTLPGPGEYSGGFTMQGSGVSVRVPYLFLVAAGGKTAFDGEPFGTCFEGLAGQDAGSIGFRFIDSSGLPLVGAAVTFTISSRDGAGTTLANPSASSFGYQPPACTITSTGTSATCTTDQYGFALADVMLPSQVGANPTITGRGAGYTATFGGRLNCPPAVIAPPTIASITDASSGSTSAVAGSYIAIKGTNLANSANISAADGIGDYAFDIPLPLSLDGVTVSFDVPGDYNGQPKDYNGAPGALTFVGADAGTVLVQVPWEVQGKSSVQVKVTSDFFAPSNVITVPLVPYAPSVFTNPDGSGIAYAYDVTTQSEVTTTNPVHAGDTVEFWANGLGPVNNQPPTGALPNTTSDASTTTTPTLTIGGVQAKVTFSGLDFNSILDSPYLMQYGVTVKIPSGLANGNLPVVLSIGGVNSSPLQLPVGK